MSNPANHPRNHQPAAGPGRKKGSPRPLRVLSEEGALPTSMPSIAMPRAKTDLSQLLAGDKLLCVGRRPPAIATRSSAGPGMDQSAAYAAAQVESPQALTGQPSSDSSPRGRLADADLEQVIDAWPSLPHHIRTGIMAMIRATAL